MSDPKPTSFPTLPPGCRFYPSEEQLLSYYLHHKNHHPPPQQPPNVEFYDTIKEIGLYEYSPFELPELCCFRFGYRGRKRHWYCFTERRVNEEDRIRAGLGFWKRKGRVRDVMANGGNVVLGRRKCFIFYLEKLNGKTAVRTDWSMYEYALIDNLKASFVVCRVFVKSRGRNSISEHALSSCAEESVATVRHIGIQHDASTLSILDDGKAHGCYHVNGKIADQSTKLIEETEPNNPVKSPGHASSADLVGSLSDRHFLSILEGDYFELDDLV